MTRALKEFLSIAIGTGLVLSAPAALSDTSTDTTAAGGEQKPLDLRAPDITKLYSPEKLKQLLAQSPSNIETVEVEATRVPAPARSPEVWGGIAAPLWALLNPKQAWRILAPVPPDRAEQEQSERPDREPVILPK